MKGLLMWRLRGCSDKFSHFLSGSLSIDLPSEMLSQFWDVAIFLRAELPAIGSTDQLTLIKILDHQVENVSRTRYLL